MDESVQRQRDGSVPASTAVDVRCSCRSSKSARRTRRGRGASKPLPRLVDDVVLVTLQRRALGTGDERAQQVATLAVVRREGTAPAVATERDDGDAVGRANAAYSPFGSMMTARRPRSRARSSIIFTTVLLPAPIEPATMTFGLDTKPAA